MSCKNETVLEHHFNPKYESNYTEIHSNSIGDSLFSLDLKSKDGHRVHTVTVARCPFHSHSIWNTYRNNESCSKRINETAWFWFPRPMWVANEAREKDWYLFPLEIYLHLCVGLRGNSWWNMISLGSKLRVSIPNRIFLVPYIYNNGKVFIEMYELSRAFKSNLPSEHPIRKYN